jgi:hypothetical protein
MKTWKARIELREDGSWSLDACAVSHDRLRALAQAMRRAADAVAEEAAAKTPLRFIEQDARSHVGRSVDAATALERRAARANEQGRRA